MFPKHWKMKWGEGLKCVIGIDGGGTKTFLRMTDLNGNVLVEETGGLSNICASSRTIVEENLKSLMNKCFEKAPKDSEVVAVCIGSAGVVARENVAFFKEFLRETTKCGNIIVQNDAYIALYANLEGKPGVSITAGTGSICCGKNRKGDFWRVGGWGHLFSDEGSAYDITVSALREILKSHDRRSGPTLLSDKMLALTGVKTAEELVSSIYMTYSDKTSIAGLSKVVDAAAAEGDITAIGILEKAAADLYAMCTAVIKRLDLSKDAFTVVLNGGVFKNSHTVRNTFARLVKEEYPAIRVTEAKRDAAWGSVYLAIESLSL